MDGTVQFLALGWVECLTLEAVALALHRALLVGLLGAHANLQIATPNVVWQTRNRKRDAGSLTNSTSK